MARSDYDRRFVTVPLLDLQAQYAPLRQPLLDALARVADSQRFIMGPEVDAFEREVAAVVDVRHAIGVSSGTDAVLAALMALDVGPGDEVIVPSLTFVATVNTIVAAGATPVFADIVGPADLSVSPDSIERCITERTKAIAVLHYAGFPCAIDSITEIASQNGIPVVEDCAHAPGASLNGRALGSWGSAGSGTPAPSTPMPRACCCAAWATSPASCAS